MCSERKRDPTDNGKQSPTLQISEPGKMELFTHREYPCIQVNEHPT